MGITFDFAMRWKPNKQTTFLRNMAAASATFIWRINRISPSQNPNPNFFRSSQSFTDFGYDGPITLELVHDTPMEEIAKCKALFDRLLSEF